MRTRCVGHACLEIETSGLRIVTDPWWEGPAFAQQWHPWPLPQPAGLESRTIDYLYLSHRHEDHFHPATLKKLRPGAAILLPEILAGDLAGRLRDLGFVHIIELPHGEPVQLRRGLRATCYVNVDESILVLEDGDRVTVNINDALHAAPHHVIEHFCKALRERHPVIDSVFMGYAGNYWWPNCVRLPGKNDRQVARAREALFGDNFVRVMELLQPRVACAYGASFVVLEPNQRWLNEVRLETPTPDLLFAQKHPNGSTRAHLLLPNDVVDGSDIVEGTTPKPTLSELKRAYTGVLREAADRAAYTPLVTPDLLRQLLAKLDARVRANGFRVAREAPFSIEIRLREKPETALHIEVKHSGARAALGAPRDPVASLEIPVAVLEGVLHQDCGIDNIVAGHGAVITLQKPAARRYVDATFRLLSPEPATWQAMMRELRRDPKRTLSALWRQRWPLLFATGAKLGVLPGTIEARTVGVASEPAPKKAA